MRRRTLSAALALAAIGSAGLAAAPGAVAAQHINACVLQGNASFDQPLFGPSPTNTSGTAFGYSFTGTLSNCQSSGGGPASGTIAAGKANGLPDATGTGSCGSSTTDGTSVVTWADKTYTVVKYKTTGYGAAIALTGSVINSVQKDTFTKDANGNEIYITITTNQPATPVNDYVGGALAFGADPTACGPTGAGVKSATITGAIGTGNYQ